MPPDFQRPFTRPQGATELVLVRHGSSVDPRANGSVELIDGRSDPPLSDRGRRQALAVADRLASEDVGGLFVTPLRRTAETAEPLAARTGHQAVVIDELREVFLGDWEHDFRRRVGGQEPLTIDVFGAQRWDVIPNAENMDSFAERVRAGMDRIADLAGTDTVAVAIVHGGVIAEICRQATGSTAFAFLYAENGSISRVLRLASGRWALRSFNDISHLTALTAEPAVPG